MLLVANCGPWGILNIGILELFLDKSFALYYSGT